MRSYWSWLKPVLAPGKWLLCFWVFSGVVIAESVTAVNYRIEGGRDPIPEEAVPDFYIEYQRMPASCTLLAPADCPSAENWWDEARYVPIAVVKMKGALKTHIRSPAFYVYKRMLQGYTNAFGDQNDKDDVKK